MKIFKNKYFLQKTIQKNFASIYYNEDGKLSDKYYKPYIAPKMFTDVLDQPSKNLEQVMENNQKNKIELFKSHEEEKKFLENKKLKFQINRKVYNQILEKGMLGDAVKIDFKNLELFLIGTMYDRIEITNLYRLLNYIDPEYIILQARPDKLLSNLHKYYQENNFISKLIRDPWELQPSLKMKEEIRKRLIEQRLLLQNSELLNKHIVARQKSFKDLSSDRLSKEAISTVSIWGELKSKKILAFDMPEDILLEKISNCYTLLQIRQFFEETFIQFPNNPDFEPRTSLGTAINLFPEVFVHESDSFLAHGINELSQLQTDKKIRVVSFLGYGQTQSLPMYLNYDLDRNNLNNVLTVPSRLKTLISGEDSLEILVEKWTLLFIIINGIETSQKALNIDVNVDEETLELNQTKSIKIIEKLINKYARDDMNKTGFNSETYLKERMAFLFEKILDEKCNAALQLIGKGYSLKKKDFVKRIYNDPLLNSQLV